MNWSPVIVTTTIFSPTSSMYDSSELLGTDKPVPVYRARKNGWPVAAVLAAVAPDGYNGAIRLLVAVNLDGTLAGVRVVQHRETPGLGDADRRPKGPTGFWDSTASHCRSAQNRTGR